MISSDFLLSFVSHRAVSFITDSNKTAELTSSCSDTERGLRQLWSNRTATAMECIELLLVLPLLPNIARNSFWTEKIRDHLSQQCFHNRYAGKWIIVQELLELRTQSTAYQLEVLMKHYDSYFIFGNLLPGMMKAAKSLKTRQAYISVEEDRTPVNYPQLQRGYNDKGNLPDLQRLSLEHYYKRDTEPREDRRLKTWVPRSHEWLISQR